MTATERLRALLDERGVEWTAGEDECDRKTHWESNGLTWEYFNDDNGDAWLGFLGACEQDISPEQAVAATLGETPTPPPPTMPEQPPYDLLIDLLRDEWGIDVSWDGLRRFWYVGLNEKGVRMRDEREAATLGPGTCRAVSMRERDKRPYLHDELVCSKCGCQLAHEFGHVWQNYCPECGKRVVG